MRLTLLFTFFIVVSAQAGTEIRRMAPQFHKISSEEIETYESQAKFTFKIQNIDELTQSTTVRYSIDGKEALVKLNHGDFSVTTAAGKHKFIIYINENYEEMYSDFLEIKGGYEDTYNVYARGALIEVIMDKPVIYLYPEAETNLSIQVEPKGEMTFTYPAYEEGWNVTAHPDGTINHNGESYNYLFWEAKKEMAVSNIAKSGAHLVAKEDVVSFLEKRLSEAGFNSKEKADFITYWGPRMMAFDHVFAEFIQNEDCDQFASLDISPKPDHVNRFYMTWGEYTSGIIIAPNPVVKMNRDGFDALEWGGQQVILETQTL